MANQNQTIIQLTGGTVLDVSEDIGRIGVTYSIDDIKNISKRNTAHSKTIILPGTPNNNQVFGNLFDINSDFTFFNPAIKTPAKIVVNTTTVLDGFLQLKKIEVLKNVDLQGNQVLYHCVIFDKALNFYNIIKNKKLSDLDFSKLDHTYTRNNIVATWTNTYKEFYTYPMLYKGSNDYETSDFKPAIFHKAYLEKIAEESEFLLGGSFMTDNTEYEKEIIPYNADKPQLNETVFNQRKFKAGRSNKINIKNLEMVNFNMFKFGYLVAKLPLNDDSTSPNFDNGSNFNTSNNLWELVANGNYNLKGKFQFEIVFSAATGNELWLYRFERNVFGATLIKLDVDPIDLDIEIFAMSGGTLPLAVNSDQIGSTIIYKRAIQFPTNSPQANPSSPALAAGTNIKFTVNGELGDLFINFPLMSGNTIQIGYRLRPSDRTKPDQYWMDRDYRSEDGLTIENFIVQTSLLFIGSTGIRTQIFNEPLKGESLKDGETMEFNPMLPIGYKQSVILDDIIKRYNLYIQLDPDNDRKLILDTRDNFYSAGTTIDWTQKKDYSTKDKIELLSELQTKEMLFSYKSDNDIYNSEYTSITGKIYGEKKVIFSSEFTKGQRKIQTPFSPTPLVYDSIDNKKKIVSFIDTREPKNNLRILYYDGTITPLDTSGIWNFTYIDNSGNKKVAGQFHYPYAGHLDDPVNPTIDLNYDQTDFFYYTEVKSGTTNNLFNRYWRNHIEQIADGKLVTSKFKLDEVDIGFIRENMNTKIFVKDSYYFINKIIDYDPVNPDRLTTVELLKIKDSVGFTPQLIAPSITYTQTETDTLVGGTPTTTKPLRTDTDLVVKDKEVFLVSDDGDKGGGTVSSTDDVVMGVLKTGYGDNNKTYSPHAIVSGKDNFIGRKSSSVMIMGDRNIIDNDVHGAMILGGDDNRIGAGLDNILIIGTSGKTINDSNKTLINDIEIFGRDIIMPTGSSITVDSVSAVTITASTISADTIFSGSTSLNELLDQYFASGTGVNSIIQNNDRGNIASANDSIALGHGTIVSEKRSVVMGLRTLVAGSNSFAVGSGATVTSTSTESVAFGKSVRTAGRFAMSVGERSEAQNDWSIAMGQVAKATATGAAAFNRETLASGVNSHAEGRTTIASGAEAHAEGRSTLASGIDSHAEGLSVVASGDKAHAEGLLVVASGDKAHAEGELVMASGERAHAEGLRTVASGDNSHAEGSGSTASTNYSHAEGYITLASGTYGSHAEGWKTTASGNYSHSEGGSTLASGADAHAEGYGTIASGIDAHSQGYSTIASGNRSFAAGTYSIATSGNSFSFGERNEVRADKSVILGGSGNTINEGISENRISSCAIIGGYKNIIYPIPLSNTNLKYSSIIGGSGHTIAAGANFSVILGGENIIANEPNTVYVPNLQITGTTIFNPSSTKNIDADTGISGITNTLVRIQGSDGAINISKNPQIELGTDGQIMILEGKDNTNTVQLDTGDGLHLVGGSAIFGKDDAMFLYYDSSSNEWEEIARSFPSSEKSWAFMSRDANSGTNYIGGFYKFGGASSNFSSPLSFGTIGSAYGAHTLIVQEAGASGGTDTVIAISGTSITDGGVRTTTDTEIITIDNEGSSGTYYETSIKWIGQVTINKISGPFIKCNYGLTKYWDNNNSNFRITGFEATWLGAKNDNSPDIKLRHHHSSGWTYNVSSEPIPPPEINSMATDYNTEIMIKTDEEGSWKRDNLNTPVIGNNSEGTIIELITTTNRTYAIGNFLLRIRPK